MNDNIKTIHNCVEKLRVLTQTFHALEPVVEALVAIADELEIVRPAMNREV